MSFSGDFKHPDQQRFEQVKAAAKFDAEKLGECDPLNPLPAQVVGDPADPITLQHHGEERAYRFMRNAAVYEKQEKDRPGSILKDLRAMVRNARH